MKNLAKPSAFLRKTVTKKFLFATLTIAIQSGAVLVTPSNADPNRPPACEECQCSPCRE